jgi:hypothetical protein
MLTPSEMESLKRQFFESFVPAGSTVKSFSEEKECPLILTSEALKEMIKQQVNVSLTALGISTGSVNKSTMSVNKEGLGYKKKEHGLLDQMALKRQEKAIDAKFCEVCLVYHPDICVIICGKCKETGHRYKDCAFMLEESEVKDRKVYTVGRPQCSICKETQMENCSLMCPGYPTFALEHELWNLQLKGDDLESYTNKFLELSHLCPRLVEPEYVKIARYIWGLPKHYQNHLTTATRETLESIIEAADSMRNLISLKEKVKAIDEKMKRDGDQVTLSTSKRATSRRKCFRCHKSGHLVKNCPVER